jgi:putative peptidoglycan lipid II flippase
MGHKSIIRGTVIIAVSVLLSRILGILREVLLASLAGINVEKNAYDLAFLIPDIVNHLISTGYLSITFIPIFTGYLVRSEEKDAWNFFSNIITCFSVIILGVAAFSWIFAEPLILLLTRTDPDSETLGLAVRYCRIILPAQICFFMGALLTAIQHVKLRFFLPAMTGLIYNATIILCGWLGRGRGLEGFAWGVLIGAALGSLLLQAWGGIRAGLRYHFRMDFFHADFIRYMKLTLPLILGLGAVFALEIIFMSYGPVFGKTGIARLGYAYRMMYTLVAVFGFSVGVASYPLLARLAKEGSIDKINEILFGTLGKIMAVLVPFILVFWFLAEPVTRILFQRGEFGPEATVAVAGLFKYYLWSAIALSSQVIILRCFYSLEKMWTPTLINTAVFLLTLPLYELFSRHLGITGIPLAGGIGVSCQVVVLMIFWIKLGGTRGLYALGIDALKIAASFLILFLAISGFDETIFAWMPDSVWKLTLFTVIVSVLVFGGQIVLQLLFRTASTISLLREFVARIYSNHPS